MQPSGSTEGFLGFLTQHGVVLNSDDATLWHEYFFDLKRFEARELAELGCMPFVREPFWKAAIVQLITPYLRWSPIEWPNEGNLYYMDTKWLRVLPEKRLDFAVLFALEAHSALMRGTRHVSAKVLDDLNDVLIALLRCTNNEALVNAVSLRTAECFINLDEYSGYQPFMQILGDSSISGTAKQAIDARMRDQVAKELAGKALPRQQHESAAHWYHNTVDGYGTKLPYSSRLFIEQIMWIVGNGSNWPLSFSDRTIQNAWSNFEDADQPEARLKFARFVFVTHEHEPAVELIELYAELIKLFADQPALVARLRQLKSEASEIKTNQDIAKQEKADKLRAVLARMR